MTKFVNQKRKCGSTTEGFGPDAFVWYDYEILCPCGQWSKEYGDISRQVGDDPDVQEWLCPKCCLESLAEEARQLGQVDGHPVSV